MSHATKYRWCPIGCGKKAKLDRFEYRSHKGVGIYKCNICNGEFKKEELG